MGKNAKRIAKYVELMDRIKNWLVASPSSIKECSENLFKNLDWYKEVKELGCYISFEEDNKFFILYNPDWVSSEGRNAGFTFDIKQVSWNNFHIVPQAYCSERQLDKSDNTEFFDKVIHIIKASAELEAIEQLEKEFDRIMQEEFKNIYINKKYKELYAVKRGSKEI